MNIYRSTRLSSPAERVEADIPEISRASRFSWEERVVGGRLVSWLIDQASGIRVMVSGQDGAELAGLAVREAGQWRELLYCGGDWRPVSGWQGRGPWLWPIAGRCYDKTGQPGAYVANGKQYEMPAHGFIRDRAWSRQACGASDAEAYCELTYTSTPADHEAYPYDYELTCRYTLSGEALMIAFACRAAKSNCGAMPFHIGQHLTFDFSSWWGADWQMGHLVGLGGEAWRADERKLAAIPAVMPKAGLIGDASSSDLIIPARGDCPALLVSPDGSRVVELLCSVTEQGGGDPRAWVTYGDPDGRFFCLEPWVGRPNTLNTGEGLVLLKPGEEWRFNVQIAIRRGRETVT